MTTQRSYIADNEDADAVSGINRLIRASADAQGIKDALTLTAVDFTLIERDEKGEVTNARQVVAELKARHPELFHKPASEMTQAEYEQGRKRFTGAGRSSNLI